MVTRNDSRTIEPFEKEIACAYSSSNEVEEIEVPNLDPKAEYRIRICFSNEWGTDINYASDELPPFMISAVPGTPKISYTKIAEDHKTATVLLNFETEENAGSVSGYRLHTNKRGSNDWSTSSVEADSVERKLERKATYYFYVVPRSIGGVIDINKKSDILVIKT